MTAQLLERPAVSPVCSFSEPSVGRPVPQRPVVARDSARLLSSERAAAAGCARSNDGYRMSRWQRLAMTSVVVTAAVVSLVTVLSGPSVAVGKVVTARAGDTVGSIVLREMPTADPLRAMELTQALNGLSDGYVTAGASVRLPELP